MRYLLPMATALALTAAAAISFARAEPAGEIAVTAWARATPPGASTGAAYASVTNHGSEADSLVAATSPLAARVEIHTTEETDGVARMRPLTAAAVPAGGTLDMRPGGVHLMLMQLSAPLKEGDSLPLTLTFERAGEVTVEAQVAKIGANAPEAGEHDHGMQHGHGG